MVPLFRYNIQQHRSKQHRSENNSSPSVNFPNEDYFMDAYGILKEWKKDGLQELCPSSAIWKKKEPIIRLTDSKGLDAQPSNADLLKAITEMATYITITRARLTQMEATVKKMMEALQVLRKRRYIERWSSHPHPTPAWNGF